jgi:hypothetical protein
MVYFKRALIKRLEGKENFAEVDGYLITEPRVGQFIRFGKDDDIWTTTPVERIEVAGRSMFIYTQNSTYEVEFKDDDNETNVRNSSAAH